jgi:hypothetical protein
VYTTSPVHQTGNLCSARCADEYIESVKVSNGLVLLRGPCCLLKEAVTERKISWPQIRWSTGHLPCGQASTWPSVSNDSPGMMSCLHTGYHQSVTISQYMGTRVHGVG